ncbi:modification methylase [Parasaccharibacter sp. TMW2.1882]|uniref:Methyltransferase n=3 Tax=Acetobacteraceae TaxID=433 RepID=A0A7U7G457_9PROT|nr:MULTISPECIES: DNA methyltransferase [Acetobacteraceae]MCL1562508.1 site-specific DNA-methyltransferase [Parasaccharibacter sp. TMW 2.1886]MCQ0040729.1 site-specific DNA-methyltransferase [Bombella sp.]MUG79795.1 site-specific DNA-methyltransferase [Bombella sp. ESL0380]MUH03087.1 site-specific DNA-methyltransferase [Bombella sp. ESL0387]QGT75410.1 site-specific DNA-methyltransferase [Bombella sp. ESL0368]
MKADMPLNRILRGECVEVMKTLPDASVNCVFADPPYNLQLRGELRRPDESVVDGVDDDWDKFTGYEAYDEFTRAWLGEARRLLHKDGTIWVIGSYHNIFRLGAIMQDLGFWILNDIIWRKSNPMPNFRGRRFTNAHETLIWAARGPESKYRFNYQAMKALNEDLQMRSDWYLPLCTGNERLKNDHGLKLHPTQKPESLLHRTLLAATVEDDVVLDPFCGTGTTPAVAKKLGRRYLAIERHPDYIKAAEARLERVEVLPADQLEITPAKREMPRIPFGSFVENGSLPAGTVVYDRQKRLKARVSPDGTLVSGQHRGSIHKLGALLTNAASCNGWTFWYFERDGQFLSIDTLRQETHLLRRTA